MPRHLGNREQPAAHLKGFAPRAATREPGDGLGPAVVHLGVLQHRLELVGRLIDFAGVPLGAPAQAARVGGVDAL